MRHEIAVRIARIAHTDMTESIEYAFACKDAVRRHQVRDNSGDGIGSGHVLLPCDGGSLSRP